jgi:hypothetical protein
MLLQQPIAAFERPIGRRYRLIDAVELLAERRHLGLKLVAAGQQLGKERAHF